MPRALGTKVVICKCGRRCVGLPKTRVTCAGCKKRVTIKEGPRVPASDRR